MNSAPLFVIGLGPGNPGLITGKALAALSAAGCIAGYDLYLKLLPEEYKAGKRIIASGMTREKERCAAAIKSAESGVATALVCSGDPGIYAMASLCLELMEARGLIDRLAFEIIPGVPAFCAAAALLGAPIGHDFACVSLSDLLTPWSVIEKRLECAFAADFVVVLYNPRSNRRPDYLAQAIAIAKKYRPDTCPVGLARNAARAGERIILSDLAGFDPRHADMLSLVIIGNCETRVAGSYMLTPRGYAKKDSQYQ